MKLRREHQQNKGSFECLRRELLVKVEVAGKTSINPIQRKSRP